MLELQTRYACWKISRDFEKPMENCPDRDQRCLVLARGEICPIGNTVDF